VNRPGDVAGIPSRRVQILGIALIYIATLAVYVPAMRGGFIWDDDDNVTESAALRSWDGLRRIWFEPGSTQQFYPVTHTSFWIQYQLSGPRPFPYHLLNVLLHATGAVLLWFVLKRLMVPGAWLAGSIFALHPVHVESVAWVTERKNVLAGVFFLAAILAYVHHAGLDRTDSGQPTNGPSTPGNSRKWYVATLILACAALLAKSATAVLPAILLVIVWWKRGRIAWRDVVPILPLFAVAIGMGATTAWLERHHVGAAGNEWRLTLLEKIIAAGRIAWFYAGKLVWPANLIFIYPRWRIDSSQPWQYLYSIAAVAVLFAAYRLRHRIGGGPFAALAIFILGLGPASGFFNVYFMRYSYVQDHFQYFASMSFIALLAALITVAVARLKTPTIAAAVVPVAILATLGVATWLQCRIYRDSETLYRTTIAKNPSAWMAHHNLAHLLMAAGKTDEALASFAAALAIRPDDVELLSNAGIAFGKAGRPEEAYADFQKALALEPNSLVTRLNYGTVLIDHGKVDEAISQFEAALRLNPHSADAHCNMGVALRLEGQIPAAVAEQEAALRIDPDHASAHINLGGMLFRQGKVTEAIDHFEHALRVQPGSVEAHLALGQCYWSQNKYDLAVAEYRRALELQPTNADAANNLAWVLATSTDDSLRDGAEAVRLAELACKSTQFKNAGMLDTLAAAYAEAGRFDTAATTARQALALLATASGDRAKQIEDRLALYEAHRPYRK
jgi:Tfp pilus assembly protein PilF